MLEKIRNSEAYKLVADISLGHWIFTIVLPFAAGGAGVLHGLSLEGIILLFLSALTLFLAISYYWRKHQLLTNPKPPQTKKRSLWRFAIAPGAFLILVVGHFLPISTLMGSVIKITKVETLPPFYQGGQYEPGKRPMVNVHYYNGGTDIIKFKAVDDMIYLSLPKDWNDGNEKYEDQFWDGVKVRQKYIPKGDSELVPGKPMFLTLFDAPPGLPADAVRKITDTQAVMYVMLIFSYHDLWGEHESEFCGYVFGDPRVLHQCHKHNTP